MVIFNSYVKLPEGILLVMAIELWMMLGEWWHCRKLGARIFFRHTLLLSDSWVPLCMPSEGGSSGRCQETLGGAQYFRHGTGKNQHISGWKNHPFRSFSWEIFHCHVWLSKGNDGNEDSLGSIRTVFQRCFRWWTPRADMLCCFCSWWAPPAKQQAHEKQGIFAGGKISAGFCANLIGEVAPVTGLIYIYMAKWQPVPWRP